MRLPVHARGAALLVILAGCRGADARPASRGPPRPAVESLMAAGERYYFAAKYDSARAAWAAARGLAPGDSLVEARVLTVYGLAAFRRADFDSARHFQERALALKHRAGLREELLRSYNALGLVAWQQGRLAEALAWFDSAGSEARRKDSLPAIAAVLGNVALVRFELGEFAAARSGFERAIDAARRGNAWRPEANATNNLGMLLLRTGRPAAAIPMLQRARTLYQEHDYVAGLEQSFGQLGAAYVALGDLREGRRHLDSALAQARAAEDRQAEAANLEVLAGLARDAGDMRGAIALLGEAQAINIAEGLEIEAAANQRAQAEIFLAMGNASVARARLRDALARHIALGARNEALFDRIELSRAARRSGDAAFARTQLRWARALADSVETPHARAAAALAAAEASEEDAAWPDLLRVLARDSLAIAHVGFDFGSRAHALRARAYLELGQLADAESAARAAVRQSEQVRRGLQTPFLRASFAIERVGMYGTLAQVLRRRGRDFDALAAADAARGLALVERIRRDSALAELERLRFALDSLERLPAGERAVAAEARRGVSARLEAAQHPLAASEPAGLDAAAAGRLPGALRADEALIEYLVTPERVLMFVVTPAGVRIVDSPARAATLTARVRTARELLGRASDSERSLPVLEALHREIFEPLVAHLPETVRHLVIVPHGPLHALPFAALRDARSGRFVVESWSVRYAASASAFAATESRARTVRAPDRVTVLAPFPERLPGTLAEADAVSGAFRASSAERVVGAAATARRLRDALAAPRLVHVATHATLNADEPSRSRLEMAAGPLEARDVLAMRIRAPWVFLSGCETGVAGTWETAFGRGDDVATLGAAFNHAGALGVVVTLWRIPDRAAAVLATRYYGHLPRSDAAEALARAQRDLLADPAFRTPYHWAAHVLAGARGSSAQGMAGTSVTLSYGVSSTSRGSRSENHFARRAR